MINPKYIFNSPNLVIDGRRLCYFDPTTLTVAYLLWGQRFETKVKTHDKLKTTFGTIASLIKDAPRSVINS